MIAYYTSCKPTMEVILHFRVKSQLRPVRLAARFKHVQLTCSLDVQLHNPAQAFGSTSDRCRSCICSGINNYEHGCWMLQLFMEPGNAGFVGKTVLKKPLWQTQSLFRRPSIVMETIEYPIPLIVKMMVMEFKHVQKRFRIVMKHLSHPVPNICRSQISSLETQKLCLLNFLINLNNCN